jgi:hypothetical protein
LFFPRLPSSQSRSFLGRTSTRSPRVHTSPRPPSPSGSMASSESSPSLSALPDDVLEVIFSKLARRRNYAACVFWYPALQAPRGAAHAVVSEAPPRRGPQKLRQASSRVRLHHRRPVPRRGRTRWHSLGTRSRFRLRWAVCSREIILAPLTSTSSAPEKRHPSYDSDWSNDAS